MLSKRLELPPLLTELIVSDRWRHPGDESLVTVIPFLGEPVNFLTSPVGGELFTPFLEDAGIAATFHLYRGSAAEDARALPWLDADLAVVIASSRFPGDDVAIALDYRTGCSEPRVVSSDWSDGHSCRWRAVAPDFAAFAERLGLTG
jgi:hypothetical protein